MSEETLNDYALSLAGNEFVVALKEGGISEKHIAATSRIIAAVNGASLGLLEDAVEEIGRVLLLLEISHNSAIEDDEVLMKRILNAVSPAVFHMATGRPVKNIK